MDVRPLEAADLTRIRSFLAVADAKSFTRAAAALSLSQQAVSAHVRQLEQRLGLELLQRTTRSVEPTPAGATFADAIRALVDQVDALWASTQAAARRTSGTVQIGMSPGAANEFAQDLVECVAELYSGITIRLRELQPLPLIRAVQEGSLDIGLVLEPPEHHDLDGFPLVHGTIAALLDRRLPLAQKRQVRVDELRDLKLFLPSAEANPYLAECARRFVEEAHLTRFETAVGASGPPRAVYDGTAFAIWPTALSSQYAPAGVAVVPFADAHQPTAVWLVYRREPVTLATRHVIDAARQRSPLHRRRPAARRRA